jgi:hypothetical protein
MGSREGKVAFITGAARVPRRDHQVAVGHDGPVGERVLPLLRVHPDRADTEAQVQPERGGGSRVTQPDPLRGPHPGQDLLGQRQPVVRQLGLGSPPGRPPPPRTTSWGTAPEI